MMRGAIFDVDGTLLDSMFIWETIGEEYLRSLGYTSKENLAKTFQTFSLEQSADYYRKEYGVPLTKEEIIDGVNQMVEHFYMDTVKTKPGVEEFLALLYTHGVKMCIATATDRYLVEAALERCGIRKYFSEIFTCTSVGHSKKEPHIYREANANLGTPKAETYVFEDACHAAQTAAADGFPVVAVYDPSEKQQAELQQIAQIYLRDFEDIAVIQNLL